MFQRLSICTQRFNNFAVKGTSLLKSKNLPELHTIAVSEPSTLTTPPNQVDAIIKEVSHKSWLELNVDLPQAQTASSSTYVHQEQSFPAVDIGEPHERNPLTNTFYEVK